MIHHFEDVRFKPLNESETLFKRFCAAGIQLELLTQQVKPILPFQADWVVTHLSNDTITIATSSATAASQLRQWQNSCLHLIRQINNLQHISKIRVSLYTPISHKLKPLGKPRVLTERTKNHLAQAADMFKDPDIVACLKRLSELP